MKVRLLVCDVDGTLLDPAGQLTARTCGAVRAAVAAGCVVTLATGRRFRSAKPIADALGLELPILVQNGALIKDSVTEEVLYHHHLSVGAARFAVTHFWEAGVQPLVYENAFDGERVFAGPVARDGDANRAYLARNRQLVRCATLNELLPRAAPLEVAAFEQADVAAALTPGLIHADFRTHTLLYSNGTAFLEVLASGCSKATALRELARRLAVPIDATMAIGDNTNDLELLSAAGLGVAMGNASPQVMALARHITASNAEDGVAEAIARYVLEQPLEEVVG